MSARQPIRNKPDSHREESKHQPPQWAQRFIEWYCKPKLAKDLMGDLNEYFERNVESRGPLRAKLTYTIDAFKCFRLYTVRRTKTYNPLNQLDHDRKLHQNIVTQLNAQQMFSTINIVGLAISVSVGFLVTAFVLDLGSYDRFNKNGERIYRITSHSFF